MLNKRIKTSVFRHDMEIGPRLNPSQDTDIESNVEIQRIRAIPGDLDVFGPISHLLQRRSNFKRYFRLIGSNKHQNLKVILIQHSHSLRLHVFVVNQNVVCFQGEHSYIRTLAFYANVG